MDKRLVTCAKLCTGDFVCDVGTDHGYLPCFMIKE
ncbi:SAM-dependent methyltransferase, partial [Ruminococcus bicirculans (ex Wegman et al. 2014)]